jgi:adenylate cyclase
MANKTTTRSRLIRLSPFVSGALVIVALAGSTWLVPAPFERLRLATFDALQRAFPWNPPDVPVTVVDVDETSLARYGQWPWPRSELAVLVDRLRELGAASSAFDIVFAEPDRTSPSEAIAQLPAAAQNELKSAGIAFPDNDRAFAAAIGKGGVTLGFGLIATPTPRPVRPKASFAIIGGDPASNIPQFTGTVLNIPVLEDAATGLGSISIVAGTDEIVRRLPLVELSSGQVVPSLALEALRVATGEPTVRLRLNRAGADGAVESMTLALADMEIPLDREGALLLHHRQPRTTNVVSAANVLDGSGDAIRAKIKNHIVFIGTSALGLADLRATPLNAFEPGIDLQAAAATQILASHFLSRPAIVVVLEMLAALIAGGILLGCLHRFGLWAAAATGAILLLAICAETIVAFRFYGLLIDPVLPAMTVAATFFVASLFDHFLAKRKGALLAQAFAQYLSPDLVKELYKNPDQVRLGGEDREMTFLFTDLAGFTRFAEAAAPERLVTTLNAYLDGLCRIATRHGGTIDKIVGDAVHVMFNAPLAQPDHASRALAAAFEMRRFADEFVALQARENLAFGVTRIGINTGRAIVGNFGGAARFDYTAHGDAVNTAARLEVTNKVFGTAILISKATRNAVPDVKARPLGKINLRGKGETTEVFEPLEEEHPAAGYADRLGDILENAEHDPVAAVAALDDLIRRHSDDIVLCVIRDRIDSREGEIRRVA